MKTFQAMIELASENLFRFPFVFRAETVQEAWEKMQSMSHEELLNACKSSMNVTITETNTPDVFIETIKEIS